MLHFQLKKLKGGIGINLGVGLLIAFSYILFFQFSSTLSTNGDLQPWIAVWIPNFLYIITRDNTFEETVQKLISY